MEESTSSDHCKSKHFLCRARDDATTREALEFIKLKYGIENSGISSLHQIQIEMEKEKAKKTVDKNGRHGDWIQTYTGKRFYPLDPRVEDFDIRDIAWALSHIVRFCGHLSQPVVVSQHSVLVSRYCHPSDALWGLLHDMSEAYISDVSTPLKRSAEMSGYREVESKIMSIGCDAFGLSRKQPDSVHVADKEVMAAEARQFMGKLDSEFCEHIEQYKKVNEKIEPLFGREAYNLFIDRYEELTGYSIYG